MEDRIAHEEEQEARRKPPPQTLSRAASTRTILPPTPSSAARARISSFDRQLKEAALERAAVALLVVKLVDDGTGTGRPVAHKQVPDYRKEDQPNPFLEEMLREASGRLGECLPENFCLLSAPVVPAAPLLGGGGGSAADELGPSSSSSIAYLAPQTSSSGVLTDCCYFILYLGDNPPPSTNPFDDDPDMYPPPSASLSTSPIFNQSQSQSQSQSSNSPRRKYMSLRARRRRVYGICRRAPFPLPYTIILLAATPCFGLLRHQFMSLTSAFFEKKCQDDMGDLGAFLLAMSNPTTGILQREIASQSLDVPAMWLVNLLGIEHILGLVKLLMLEGRVLFYSAKASKASSAVLALLTLLPGLYNQALDHEEEAVTALHSYRWKKYGLPLRIFHEDNYLLQPLLVMTEAERVFAKCPGFLVGTSNPLIGKLHTAQLDALVDLDTCQIDSQRFSSFSSSTPSVADDVSPTTTATVAPPQDPNHQQPQQPQQREACPSPTFMTVDLARIAFEYGPADADFIEEVLDKLPRTHSNTHAGNTQEDNDSAGWDGSDSWIRKHFQVYFETFLAQAALALHGTIRDGAAAASQPPSWVRKAVTGLLQATPRTTCGFDVKLMDYNRAWVGQWTTTLNFRIWHDNYPHACLPPAALEDAAGLGALSRSGSGVSFQMAAPSPAGRTGYVECFTYPNGDTYQGEMVKDQRQGKGTYVEHATGNTYEGDWVRDLRHGKGILTTGASDFLYDGDWVHDKRDGHGHCTVRGRETYTGGFLAGRFHGQGKVVDSEGNVYEGEWAHGAKEGAGTLRKTGGETYVGEWRRGQRHGLGTFQYVDGAHYTGEWREGKRSGEGVFVGGGGGGSEPKTKDRAVERYEGQWLADQRHGWGVQACGKGDVKEGEWCQDRPKDGEWKVTYATGDQFVGHCQNGRPHGHGTCKYVSGDVYTGQWEDGLRSGDGVCIYASGETFDGRWACNEPLEHAIPPTYDEEEGEEEEEEAEEGGGDTSKSGERRRPRRRLLAIMTPAPSSPRKTQDVPPTPLAELARMNGPACTVVYAATGDTYTGEMRTGKRHGLGVYCEKATGNKYEGQFAMDRRHGKGVLSSGARDFLYDGEWVNDRRTGQGHCLLRGKESYTGQWVEDAFHGKGKYVDAAGNTYEGEYVLGKKEGAGTLMRTDGEVYVGEWKEGERQGLGQCQYADGACYSGEWHQDKWNGEGVWVSAEGDRHEGLWSEGKRMGWGIWTSPTGDVVEGEWFLDEPRDGEWKITYSNGDQFVGRCRDGRPEGFGICKYANGAVYSGNWEEGLRAGQGQCVFANGEVYDGLWEKDHVSLRGLGTLSFQDGRVHEFS